MSTINMQKGENIPLTKGNPGLLAVNFGLGWDVNTGNASSFDLDAFAIILNEQGKAIGPALLDSVVYFGNKVLPGVMSMGDNLTGAGDGDDETIKCDLAAIPAGVHKVAIYVNIFEAARKSQNFGQISNAFMRAYDANNPTVEFGRYDLTEDYSRNTAVKMGELYRNAGEWKFKAIGEGTNGQVDEILRTYC